MNIKVLRNTYKDSIELMRLSNQVKSKPGVKDAAVMLGNPANVELMKNAGLLESTDATSADIIVSVVSEDDKAGHEALAFAEQQLSSGGAPSASPGQVEMKPKTIEEGVEHLKGANFIIISSPGNYATAEAQKALKKGLHVFLFSDNVDLDDELALKKQAVAKKLFLMGPDCGTAILDGIPFGFANAVKRGDIGMIASSGTGAQQVSVLVDKMGGCGVSQLFGTGGRDLKEKIGGIMTLHGIDVLEADPLTNVITIISKGQPGPSVMKKLCERIKTCKKPVIVVLLGADGTELSKAGAYVAYTLEDAATLSIQVQQGSKDPQAKFDPNSKPREKAPDAFKLGPKQTKVVGLFAGGTHASECNMILTKMKSEGFFFDTDVIDLGDDEYCVGKPHPMIDGTTRKSVILKRAAEESTAVIIFDVVLGFGSHENPAADISEAIVQAKKDNPQVVFVGHVCGVAGDFQGLEKSEKILKDAGVILLPTNAQASRVAAQIANRMSPLLASSEGAYSKIFGEDGITALNLGLAHFTTGVTKYGGKAQQLDWKPPALGNRDVGLQLAALFPDETDQKNIGNIVEKANLEAVDRLKAGTPFFVGMGLAKDVIPGFTGKKICHAGPPITWDKMCGPMKGGILGAIVYEGWAKDLDSAEAVARNEVEFSPCHHYGAVGPMAGILSPSFPVAIIENTQFKNKSYVSMNEGLGKVLRMGANSQQVLDRLFWIKNVFAPGLAEVLAVTGPIDLRAITQQALMMGDECHNRNAAATSIFTRMVAPALLGTKNGKEVLDFLKSNDHFYLNLSMAACKATLDAASGIKGSTICTAMCRNGVDFGVRLSGTGNKWFTAKAAVIDGLFFPGYGPDDANPDIGDSSITETFGIGGFAMASAPAIVKFVGGSASDALQKTREMYRITMSKNSLNSIPILDFQGTPIGLDARKVCDSLIQPVINTGIAHKTAGIGQIGAGIALAPLNPFVEALSAVYSDLCPDKPKTVFEKIFTGGNKE